MILSLLLLSIRHTTQRTVSSGEHTLSRQVLASSELLQLALEIIVTAWCYACQTPCLSRNLNERPWQRFESFAGHDLPGHNLMAYLISKAS